MNPEYTVNFGKIARTLAYQDSQVRMLFCFDVELSKDPSNEKWTLHLGKHPLAFDGKRFETAISSDQLTKALERTRDFATSRGYKVVIQ